MPAHFSRHRHCFILLCYTAKKLTILGLKANKKLAGGDHVDCKMNDLACFCFLMLKVFEPKKMLAYLLLENFSSCLFYKHNFQESFSYPHRIF